MASHGGNLEESYEEARRILRIPEVSSGSPDLFIARQVSIPMLRWLKTPMTSPGFDANFAAILGVVSAILAIANFAEGNYGWVPFIVCLNAISLFRFAWRHYHEKKQLETARSETARRPSSADLDIFG